MVQPLFISQGKLESWVGEGQAGFEDDVLTLTEEGGSYRLNPAVQVLGIIDGTDDKDLVGVVLTLAEIQQLDGEHYRDSLIVGETAYQCEEGFVGVQHGAPLTEPAVPTIEAATNTTPAQSAEPKDEEEQRQEDSQLLVDFLLKHL